MEISFSQTACSCLKQVLCEVRSLEQAQEIRLTDGMPDIGTVLCGWGQVLQRSKEWNGDSVSLTAGMMVRVLYAPEDGSGPRWVEGWIPFTMQWDLPEKTGEGSLRIQCLTRFVDARSVSARKIMVRAGVSALAEAYVPRELPVYGPEEEIPGVELKKVRYPLRLPKEAGEKLFSLEEDLTLGSNLPPMEKLIYSTLEPEIQEQRVMGDKIVFRGNAGVHILYADGEDSLHSWDFSVPFSQYGELRESRGPEAEATVRCAVTALETERTEGTVLRLKCGLVGQYLVEDQEILELTEDAYCPGRELEIQADSLEPGAILESRRETIPAEMTIPGDGDMAMDVCFQPDFPRCRRTDRGILLEGAGTFQVLYSGTGKKIQAAVSRWEGQQLLKASEDARVWAVPMCCQEPQILMGGGDMKVRTELPMQVTVTGSRGLPMVTALSLGEEKEPDENRPSLILRRAGDRDLWEIAKSSGSTVEAIRSANGLQEDPNPGQMLLIPIL